MGLHHRAAGVGVFKVAIFFRIELPLRHFDSPYDSIAESFVPLLVSMESSFSLLHDVLDLGFIHGRSSGCRRMVLVGKKW